MLLSCCNKAPELKEAEGRDQRPFAKGTNSACFWLDDQRDLRLWARTAFSQLLPRGQNRPPTPYWTLAGEQQPLFPGARPEALLGQKRTLHADTHTYIHTRRPLHPLTQAAKTAAVSGVQCHQIKSLLMLLAKRLPKQLQTLRELFVNKAFPTTWRRST